MSVIPKISVGLPKRRSKFSMNFDNSTTSNIGNIQPTMCREMVPNESFHVGVKSLVRLASMPLPTFGRVSLRHNHVYVSMQELWQPFDAMLSAQHYHGNEQTFIPSRVPSFDMRCILPYIAAYSDITIYPKNDLENPLKIDLAYHYLYDGQFNPENIVGKQLAIQSSGDYVNRAMTEQKNVLETAINQIHGLGWFGSAYNYNRTFYRFGAGSLKSDDYGVIRCGDFYIALDGRDDYSFTLDWDYIENPQSGEAVSHDGNIFYDPSGTIVTAEGADLITQVGDYMLCLKFKAPIKRLRTIMIGLGYQFTPYNTEVEFSLLKLLAYYKGWFSLFRPDREKSFVDTNCYKLIKTLSESDGFNVSNVWMMSPGAYVSQLLDGFIQDLIRDCYYYLPMDYFGMSQIQVAQPNSERETMVSVMPGSTAGTYSYATIRDLKDNMSGEMMPGITVQGAHTDGNVNVDPILIRLAQRLLTFANKNTVIGRNIRNYLKVHYGVADTDPIDNGDVIRIGSSRVNIEISDIMSTAENSQGYLGEYGGRGIGYDKSETFDFTAPKFGFWICYTVVVPESGYYQGYLKENRHLDRYEFFMPEFDALGYQVLERGELMDSYDSDSEAWNPRVDFVRNQAFGLVPRYSEYKVGRNIVNGDLSLIGLKNSMSPYTLDRRLPSAYYSSGRLLLDRWVTKRDEENKPSEYMDPTAAVTILRPDFVPSVVYDDFRRIDPTDHLGQYNRIFNYGLNDLDHFIIHNIFNVDAVAPMKSLTTSFDTYGEEDDSSISVEKA